MGIFAALVYLVMMTMFCGTVILISKMFMEHQQTIESKRQDTIRARDMQRQMAMSSYWDALARVTEQNAIGPANEHRTVA